MEEQISSIVEALKINAEKTPDKLCVGDKKNQVTYKEFWNMVKKAAVYLQEKGVQKGDMVVIRGAQKVEFLLGVFGVQLAGGAVCPLEKAIKDDRIMEIMNFVDSNIYLAEKPVKNTTVNNISLKEMFKVVQNNEAVTPNENTDNSENVVLNEAQTVVKQLIQKNLVYRLVMICPKFCLLQGQQESQKELKLHLGVI